MGYRQYLYKVDKRLVNSIRACKTNDEYINVCKYFNIKIDDYDDEDKYCPIYNLGKELFEFGKYYENSDEMYKHGDSLFTSDELNKRYEDYGAIILDESGLLSAIKWAKNRCVDIYKDLLKEESDDIYYKNMSQLDRLKAHVDDHLRWWESYEYGACDMNKDNSLVACSWLYEHTIFNLVNIYKTFDWDNYCLIFAGW